MQCKFCGQNITFNDLIKSSSGKKIPINLDNSIHRCARNRHGYDNPISFSYGNNRFIDLFLENKIEVKY